MKRLFINALIFPLLLTPSIGQEMVPFKLKHYGHFKKMMHMKKTDGVVDLKQAISSPKLYGVGAPAHGTGEITVINGKLWLDYGVDGLGDAKHQPAKGEQAVILVTTEVSKWRDVTVPEDMSAAKLHEFILAQTGSGGLDAKKPFPFMLEGQYFDLDWHVLNGLKGGDSGAAAGGHKGLYKRIREHQADNAGKIIGFYSAASQGVYTHPGESWHLHLVIEKEGKAGHIDAVSVRKGTVLKLPVS
jgi:hypothetical protein